MLRRLFPFVLLLDLYLLGEGASGRYFECDIFPLPVLVYLVGLFLFFVVSLAALITLMRRNEGERRLAAGILLLHGGLVAAQLLLPLHHLWTDLYFAMNRPAMEEVVALIEKGELGAGAIIWLLCRSSIVDSPGAGERC